MIRLTKLQKGQDFPNLSDLQPQLVPDESQAQIIKNSASTSTTSSSTAATTANGSHSEQDINTILSQTLAKENEKRRLRGEEGPLIEMEMAESERKLQGMDLGQDQEARSGDDHNENQGGSQNRKESNGEGLPTTTIPSRMVGSNSTHQNHATSTSQDPTPITSSSSNLDSNGRVIFHTSSSRVRSMSRIHEVQGDDERSSHEDSFSLYDDGIISNRKNQAEKFENSKWDESYYLDNFVDPEKEIEPLLSWKNSNLKSSSSSSSSTNQNSSFNELPDWKRSNLLVLTSILFGYLYDLRSNLGDISSNVESGYTISKLSRCLSCECMPFIRSNDSKLDGCSSTAEIKETLRESFRRALVIPLYRNWDLCETTLKDLISYFDGSTESRKAIKKALKSVEKSLELTQENNAGREEILKSYIKSIRGVRKWVENEELENFFLLKDDDLTILGKSLWDNRPKKEDVGKKYLWKIDQDANASGNRLLRVEESQEDVWEVELLEQCARQVEEEEAEAE